MHLFRDKTPIATVKSAEGGKFTTSDDKPVLDFTMGWCVGNAGWNKEEVLQSIRSFDKPVYVTPTLGYERWEVLADKLVSLMPSKKGTCFRTTGGTEAVEVALKIARAHNKREKFMAFKDAYHGQSFLCMGLVGMFKEKFGPYPDWFIHLETDDWEKTTKETVERIKQGDICAFISEPIIFNKGVLMPPKSFHQEVQKACNETNTVFIMDEVATGFGRTGKWFAFEHYNLDPDIITIAKGVSSGYAAIGAVIAKPEIAEAMRFPFSNYSTFGWHPLSVEAAISSINYLEKNNFVDKAKETGKYLKTKLSEFTKPEGIGLGIGIPCSKDIEAECLSGGLYISCLNERLAMFPTLDVTKEEIDQAISILKKHLPQ